MDLHFGLSLRTNRGVSRVVQRVSWLVVRRHGSRRQWSAAKVKVIRVRADGPRAVKDGCWAWTEGPEGRAVTDVWGHRQVQEYMG
jgi:hypothetical protein